MKAPGRGPAAGLPGPGDNLLRYQPLLPFGEFGPGHHRRLDRGHITGDLHHHPAGTVGLSRASSVMAAAFAIASAQVMARARPLTSSNPSDCFTRCSFEGQTDFGRMASTSLCGRGITWLDLTSPTTLAAALPASTAALTAPTSPRTITVISPEPIFRNQSTARWRISPLHQRLQWRQPGLRFNQS